MKIVSTDEAKELIESGNKVLVDFYATWCGPCKRLAPILEGIEDDTSDVDFVKIDIDNDIDFAQESGVMSVPTLILFENGEEINRVNGVLPESALKNFISQG